MVFTYNEEISPIGFAKLAEWISINPDVEKIVYFSSEGGNAELIPLFLDIFEIYGGKIELVGYSSLFSAGFEIFFLAKVKRKRLLDYVTGMYHQAISDVIVNEVGLLHNGQEEARFHNLITCSKSMTARALDKISFTPKERKQILSGETLFFNNERMKKFKI